MRIECCVCHKVRDERGWNSAPISATPGETSHGYCPACLKEVYKQIRRARFRAMMAKPA